MSDGVYSVLKLIGKDTTIDLLDGVNYALVSWAPAVASRERSLLGNYSPYVHVEEQIVVNVWGSSVGEALSALDTISVVMEQAEAWSLGENVPPVIFQVELAGSMLSSPLQAVVLGRGGGDASVRLQPSFNHSLLVYEIEGVEISFVRRGLWLGDEMSFALPSTLTNPAVMTVSMAERLSRLSPTTIRVTHFDAATMMIGAGYMLVSGASVASTHGKNIGIFTAGNITAGVFDSVNDAAHKAHGDNVLRIDADDNQTGSLLVPNVYSEVSRVSVFAAVRNNSTTTAWRVRAASTGYVSVADSWRTIDAQSQQPRIMYVGTVSNQSGTHINIRLDFETAADTGTLDVNYIVVFGHDPSTSFLAIKAGDYSDEAYPRALVISDRSLTHRTPLAYIETAMAE